MRSLPTSHLPPPRRAPLPLVVATLLAFACSRAPADPSPLPDLAAVAARLIASDDPILGQAQIAALEARRGAPALAAAERYDLDVELQAHLLRVGRVDEALALLDDVVQQAERLALPPSSLAQLERWRGMAWLRKAEIENCVRRHDADCCILPLRGGGLHVDRAPAERAARAWADYLRHEPDDLGARWLHNVAHMALGTWPDGVDEALRIPSRVLDGDTGVRRFTDIAPALGVDRLDLCGGAVAEDFDGDGRLDLVISSFDPAMPMALFLNDGAGGFVDRARESGLARQLGGLNCLAADHDGDGDRDLLVLRGAWLFDDGCIRNSLLENDGRGHFTDVTARAGLAEPAYPTQAAAWGDFDGDGDLDLFVGNESRREIGPLPGGDFPSQLFENRGDGTFVDVASRAGVTNDRYCKGCAVGDYDNDGDLDLYVSNVGRNRLFRNDGGMRFTDVAPELGVTGPDGRSFAAWFFDFDNDGWLDLFVAPFQATLAQVVADMLGTPDGGEVPRLYHNRGGRFVDVARERGLGRVCLPMGAGFGDADGDGWLDVYLGTGDPSFETIVPNLLFRNVRGERFVDATFAAGLGHLQKGHSVCFCDFDHDGDQDLYHQLGGFYPSDAFRNALFENPGHGNRFLVIELAGKAPNRDAFGARVRVDLDTPGGARALHRAVGSVSSFAGAPLRLELGLGDSTRIAAVEVRWPDGTRQRVEGVPLDAFVRIAQGTPGFTALERPRVAFRR